MRFLYSILPLLLLFISPTIWADESKYSGRFLGLEPDGFTPSDRHAIEFWGYYNYLGSGDYNDILKVRFYQPLHMGDWYGTMRLDTSYVSNFGPTQLHQEAGAYSAGNTLLTVWGNHPDILKNWDGSLGGRIIFPFGNNGQWAIGPQAGSVFRSVEESYSRLSDFSPLVRYMYGFTSNSTPITNQPPPLRRLDLYPTIGFNITPNTQIRFWDENGINYNTAGGGWFVPVDAMVTHRFNKDFLIAIGASKELIQTYQQYNWSFYSKLSYSF